MKGIGRLSNGRTVDEGGAYNMFKNIDFLIQ